MDSSSLGGPLKYCEILTHLGLKLLCGRDNFPSRGLIEVPGSKGWVRQMGNVEDRMKNPCLRCGIGKEGSASIARCGIWIHHELIIVLMTV